MKLSHLFTSLIVLSLVLSPGGPSLAASGPDFVTLAEELKPAVVNISTSKTVKPRRPRGPAPNSPYNEFFDEFFERFFQDQPGARKERSLGSGFIISKDGFILTNAHVVDDADEISVRLADERSFKASVKGRDTKLDVALLKIEIDGEDLPVARLGNSEELRVGEWVMAIGNPFGLEETVTVGIVSAKGRVIGAGPYDNFIQTDASINPGNSGGPLFNLRGEVVGINTAIIASGQGIGFALPINAAQQIVPQLKETGHVTRGWLGVAVQQINRELAESFGLDKPKGALVAEVVKDSPASKAGIERGDIILAFDGKDVSEMSDLPRLVAATPVGKKVKVEIFRDGKELDVKVTVAKLAEEAGAVSAAADQGESLGLSVSELTPEVAKNYGLEAGKGVVISALDPGGPAARSNLRVGDLILEINGQELAGVADFRKVMKKVEKGRVLRLLVQRGQNLFYTTLKVQ